MSYLLGVINLLSCGKMLAITEQCVEKLGVAPFMNRDSISCRGSIKTSRSNFQIVLVFVISVFL